MTPRTGTTLLAMSLLCATTLFWGGNFVLGRAVAADIPPIALAWWRWILAMAIILPLTGPSLWAVRHILWQHRWYLLGVSVLSVTCFNTFVYLGLQTLPASNAVLVLSSAPMMILGFSWLLFRERVTLAQVGGMVLSALGVLVILTEGSPQTIGQAVSGGAGNLWIIVAVTSWSLYSVLLRRRPPGITGSVFFAVTVVVGWLCLTPAFFYEHFVMARQLSFSVRALLSIGYVGFFASVLAFLFWNRGVELLGPNRAGFFIHLIPVWALVLATVLLGERLELFHWSGMAFIFAGILLASLIQRRPRPA